MIKGLSKASQESSSVFRYQWKHLMFQYLLFPPVGNISHPTRKGPEYSLISIMQRRLPTDKNYDYLTWLPPQQVGILGLLNRVQIYSTMAEQTKKFLSASSVEINWEKRDQKSLWYVNKWQGEKNKVICNRKSFIKILVHTVSAWKSYFLPFNNYDLRRWNK